MRTGVNYAGEAISVEKRSYLPAQLTHDSLPPPNGVKISKYFSSIKLLKML